MAEPTCTPVDLGSGATLESPCTGPIGWCTASDFFRSRRVLQHERNKLVGLVNRFTKLANEGKATWDAATSAAYDLTDESLAMLEKFPEDWWYVYITGNAGELIDAIHVFTKFAAACHQAACEVAAALEALGEAVPQPPIPPPPPQGITDAIAEGTRNIADAAASAATTAFYLVAGVAILGGGWFLYQSLRSPTSQVLVMPSSTPTPQHVPSPATSSLPPELSAARRATSKGTRAPMFDPKETP
ncbi:hypothetical protein [Nannocystis sp. SCPEA4]|uniref:hypothetical protein n=1 Tax=Nannocystis sp. SCPEA4 TaxID=2996787 RepID=UPI0022708930|nr:hypothetical protein [Nannocystis sp. SCPEA4]MCY1062132.1 hypothetical protein [Nannocystis sp. SCPEA4]